jgi:hypothetical protein
MHFLPQRVANFKENLQSSDRGDRAEHLRSLIETSEDEIAIQSAREV